MSKDLDLERLDALAQAATPGPRLAIELAHSGGSWFVEFGQDADSSAMSEADAAYIAAASPDVVCALIARLREAEGPVWCAVCGDETAPLHLCGECSL